MTYSEFKVTDNISVYTIGNVYEYEDRMNKIYLKFPVNNINGVLVIESPITGRRIKNYTGMGAVELILYHITKQERRNTKIKSLPYWSEYIEGRRYYKGIEYKEFINSKLEEYCNMGYSKRITTPQPALTN